MELSKIENKNSSQWKLTMVQLNGETKFVYKPSNNKGKVYLSPRIVETILQEQQKNSQ